LTTIWDSASRKWTDQHCSPPATERPYSSTDLRQEPSEPSRRSVLQLGFLALAGIAGGAKLSGWPQSAHAAAIPPAQKMLRFGLNYVPRKNWWYTWEDWDAHSIAEDLQAISDLSMDHVRVQCLWPFFQPGISYVSSAMTDRLLELLDLADRAGLDVEVTVLNGWMSGYSFLPPWVAPLGRNGNLFASDQVIEAEELLFGKLAAAVGGHRRFLGFDLGNEINVLQNNPANQVTLAQADQWASRMLRQLAALAPGKFHVNGTDHVPWFSDSGFSRSVLAATGSATVLHCYAYWAGALQYYRYNDAGSLHLLEYMTELTKAYAVSADRQVWVEEVGASSEWMPESYIPEYAETLLRNAMDCGNLWGITWWCSHDIDPSIKGFLSLEYGLGVLDTKNRVKPIGRKLASLASEMRRNPPSAIERPVAMVIPDRFEGSGKLPGWNIARQYMDRIAEKQRLAIVLESRSHDDHYLKARGIQSLIPAKPTA
jgi:hypothetical protein